MTEKRLGWAMITLVFSDREGFKVHHSDGTVFRHVAPEDLEPADWDIIWSAINKVELTAQIRKEERSKEN